MRDVSAGKTLRLDLPAAGCGTCGTGSPEAVFQLASSDGSRVLFTDVQRLTTDAGAPSGKPDLYECDITESVGGEPECKLTDLTPRNAAGESADVQGSVLGASESGSYLYFVADGVLDNDGTSVAGAHGGQPNLYVRHDGKTSLVAALSGGDAPDWAGGGFEGDFDHLTARVSPNGQYLAFTSDRELTGYDNHDAVSGQPDEEVYEYDATTGRTSCVSCNPSGARPAGEEYGHEGNNMPLVGEKFLQWGPSAWLAANVPGWTPFEKEVSRYQSRYLSNSGRLFFNARSPLVPNDVNNQWDVYEYEPENVGDCNAGVSNGSRTYKRAHAFQTEAEGIKQAGEEGPGCVGLISSGESKDESAFLDASAGAGEGEHGESGSEAGRDVFFLTSAKLAPQDVDDSYDVYDAHECTTASPCTQVATSPPPCENEASCKPAPEPEPESFGAGPSETFAGPGNLTPPAPAVVKKVAKKPVKCKRGYVKSKKGKCVRKKGKKAKKASRATNDRRAR